jgi:hypothetical protein
MSNRKDALGLWWRDEPVVKVLKTVEKCTPPDPVWLKPDYLPGIDEARAFNVPVMTDEELTQASLNREKLLFDVEVYKNYFLVSFGSKDTGRIVFFEVKGEDGKLTDADKYRLNWILASFTLIGFKSWDYDLTILAIALAGYNCATLKAATNLLIYQNWRASDVLKQFRVKGLKPDHIDLIEVAPLRASLKIYGGRLHVPRMQDLPFHPESLLSEDQMLIVRWYNVNDLVQTEYLREALKDQVALREVMSQRYKIDLRSKSDAQIAEAVISDGLMRLTGQRPYRPKIEPGTAYRYKVPHFLQFQTPLLNWALGVVANAWFVVNDKGACDDPKEVAELQLRIGASVYTMGIGGLHSTEKSVAHITDGSFILSDRDVVSYYPQIILNQGLFPPHLGPGFLQVYRGIVIERVTAKKNDDKVTADTLKITVNGSFGKFGNKYSILYSPDLVIQVTLTGQLALLMLIELLELSGIPVVSANTDGIVIKCPADKQAMMDQIIKHWEQCTNFETEEARYKALYSRDVNNYIAVKHKYDKKAKVWLPEIDGTKNKGAYNNPWNDPKQASFRMHKNPANTICVEAVEAFLTTGKPISETVRACKDIRKFVSVKHVTGGAVKNGVYLGKAIRWYYASEEKNAIIYASSGKKVPKSDGARPLMSLPSEMPTDINFEWYEKEAQKILADVGYITA